MDYRDARLDHAHNRLLTITALTEMVTVLRETARAIAGSDGIAVALRDGAFCHYVAEDAVRPLWRGRRFRLEECISGWSMLHGQAAIVSDIEADLRVPRGLYRSASILSLVMMPIGYPVPVAALGAYWCTYVDLDEGTVGRLRALADMATAALSEAGNGLLPVSSAARVIAEARPCMVRGAKR